jgi:hypothetical protein
MARKSTLLGLGQLGRLFRFWPADAATTDAGLLDAFVSRQDRDAFAVLVERYGPLVA